MTDFLTLESQQIEIKWINKQISNKPCLIFLHEGLGCVAMWKNFPEQLCHAVGFSGLVFSRLGYGKSDPSPLPWKINFMHFQALRFLPRILKAAQIKDYIIVGHSDGGSIGIIFGGSPLARGLKALITEAAHVFCENKSVASIARAKINYEKGHLKQKLEKYHGKNTDNAFRGWNDIWLNPQFLKWNIEKYLNKIQVPMLAIQGRDDQYGTVKQLESIKRGVKHIEPHLIDACRHAPHFEQPQITLDLMSRFVNRIAH